MIPTLTWTEKGVEFLDQTRLPLEETYVLATTYQEVADVITTMVVRGAPAIGVSAAMGVALGVKQSPATTVADLTPEFEQICRVLAATRPTAVNLFWAIARMREVYQKLSAKPGISIPEIREILIAEANKMYEEDIASCREMGKNGAELLPRSGGVLTHCNAGALATCGYGTALGVIRAAVEAGAEIQVYADETRPFLQGARLTAWELLHDNIPTTVICDNMAASMMRRGKIQAVVVGADRIAANGDVANKIGTYGVAVLAKEHGIPFYVAAPWSTIDMETPTGDTIPIEERPAVEVTHHGGKQLTPEGAGIENPAFDVTTAQYVTAIITERGVLRAPYPESLAELAATPAGA
ncbi:MULTISPECIES: S-methyl-5-thioribose-1-phosphate isomerase [Acidobacterium]|uniref:Methylthioribose-1-phosphate isomerase n=1 Tax=Acidobacterium capsulatum (strain ATCC 51196 / DSM 11244 / BCRC 80197 / JCM 7670 / NBRC 15755 / NCIMB 13165 / 161) TaxID=240015 RepID=C1F9T5_ACIC5|nr:MULTISPECIES: S-methyl-5-thioribose-1-phosphate isomerase [Acidobacterium]ACO31768.1 methylthioribose-1-phosphate isomerase [Acidobacterium capsulatum ATCC 51196]HCT61677.1 S-methyl-5-thioribose-1-phosphate isomerase [Acidobacterium sp.]